jgi:hypothetical protein
MRLRPWGTINAYRCAATNPSHLTFCSPSPHGMLIFIPCTSTITCGRSVKQERHDRGERRTFISSNRRWRWGCVMAGSQPHGPAPSCIWRGEAAYTNYRTVLERNRQLLLGAFTLLGGGYKHWRGFAAAFVFGEGKTHTSTTHAPP